MWALAAPAMDLGLVPLPVYLLWLIGMGFAQVLWPVFFLLLLENLMFKNGKTDNTQNLDHM